MAGHKLLRGHIANSAAARGVRRGNRCVPGKRRSGWIEACLFRTQTPRQAEVKNLYQASIREHYILRLQVAMEDAERVRCLQAVCNLNTD